MEFGSLGRKRQLEFTRESAGDQRDALSRVLGICRESLSTDQFMGTQKLPKRAPQNDEWEQPSKFTQAWE